MVKWQKKSACVYIVTKMQDKLLSNNLKDETKIKSEHPREFIELHNLLNCCLTITTLKFLKLCCINIIRFIVVVIGVALF